MRNKKSSRHIKKPAKNIKKRQRRLQEPRLMNALLVLLLALAAVLTGLSLPGLSSAIQSRNVDRLNRQEELGTGTLKLTNDEKMLEKLRLVCLDRDRGEFETVALQNGRFLSRAEAENSVEEIFALTAGSGLYTGEKENWQVYECEPFLLIPRSGDISPALLWRLEAALGDKEDELILQLILDDETGLVLASGLQGRTGGDLNHSEVLKALSGNMESYYGFQNTEFAPPEEEEMDINKYYYSIHCIKEGNRVFDIPVSMSPFGWQIGGSGGVYAVEEPYNSQNNHN